MTGPSIGSALLLGLVLATGCSEGGSEAAAPGDRESVVRYDSAGVEVVESRSAQWPRERRWMVDAVPRLSLGARSDAPTHQFFRIADVAVLSDGTIAVADGASREVRIFNADGTHRLTFGGRGQGPGEFDRISGIRPLSNGNLLVFDRFVGRASILGADGELLATEPIGVQGTQVLSMRLVNDSLAALTTYRVGGGGGPPMEDGVRRSDL